MGGMVLLDRVSCDTVHVGGCSRVVKSIQERRDVQSTFFRSALIYMLMLFLLEKGKEEKGCLIRV